MENLLNTLLPYLFYVIGTILGIVAIWVLNTYVMPYLKTKLSKEDYDVLATKIKDLMASAEDKEDKGVDKKAWVITQLKALGLTFDENYVSNLIDGFTKELTAQGIINTNKKVEVEK